MKIRLDLLSSTPNTSEKLPMQNSGLEKDYTSVVGAEMYVVASETTRQMFKKRNAFS